MKHALAADLVLVAHFVFAAFAVVGGFFVILDVRVMLAHIPVVVWSSVVNFASWTCPLTPMEKNLRQQAGQQVFEGGWVQNYLEPLVRPLGMPRQIELIAAVSVVVWNVIVYAYVFWILNGT